MDILNRRAARAFFARATLEVARELLGCRLVRVLAGRRLSGIISETEAYVGEDDLASHASVGRTARNEVMYGPPGYAYVYLIYGVHHCLNVVTEQEGFPAAVLIRGLQPQEGIDAMRRHRPGRPDAELTNGPGKLCQALRIDRTLNGKDLVAGEILFIERDIPMDEARILATARIGVRGDEAALSAPWRFVVTGYEIRDTGYEIRDTGYEIRDTGYEIRDTGYEIRDTGYEIRDTGYVIRRLSPASRIPHRESRCCGPLT